jgi:hypothetical protein
MLRILNGKVVTRSMVAQPVALTGTIYRLLQIATAAVNRRQ